MRTSKKHINIYPYKVLTYENRIFKVIVGIAVSEVSVNAADYAIAFSKMYNAELIAINVLTSVI